LTQKNYTREEKKKKKKEGGGGYTFEVPFMLRALRRWWQPIENAKSIGEEELNASTRQRKKYYPYDVRQVT